MEGLALALGCLLFLVSFGTLLAATWVARPVRRGKH